MDMVKGYIWLNPLSMLYNLKNGKTIELSTEEFFRMTDDDFLFLEGLNQGDCVEDPFYISAMTLDDAMIVDDSEQLLTDIPPAIKLHEREYQNED